MGLAMLVASVGVVMRPAAMGMFVQCVGGVGLRCVSGGVNVASGTSYSRWWREAGFWLALMRRSRGLPGRMYVLCLLVWSRGVMSRLALCAWAAFILGFELC
jgi:hypothetical protein